MLRFPNEIERFLPLKFLQYDSCEIHVLQRGLNKCVKSPMEQKCLHFPGGGEVLLELGKCLAARSFRKGNTPTCKVCNLTPSFVVCKYNVSLVQAGIEARIGVRHAAV